MVRRIVRLAFMTNLASRRACLRKRRESLIKKVQELSILCGVQAFFAVYSPDEPGSVTSWPSDELEAQQVVMRYMTMPETEKTKYMLDQESYIRGLIKKLEIKKQAQLRRMNELELAYLMDEVHFGKGLHEMDIHGLNCLSLLLKERLKKLRDKAEDLKINIDNASAIAAALGEEGEISINGVGTKMFNFFP